MLLLRRLAAASAAILSASILVACSSASPGWTYTPAPPVTPAPSTDASAAPSSGAESGAVTISAKAVAFEQADVKVPAGEAFKIEFANKDPGTPHNIVIHKGDASGEVVFQGETFNGDATQTYDVPALDAGGYTFVCTIHPTMVGTMTAE